MHVNQGRTLASTIPVLEFVRSTHTTARTGYSGARKLIQLGQALKWLNQEEWM